MHGFVGEPQPDAGAEDEDGRGDGRASQGGLLGSERNQVHAGSENRPDQGAIREVQSRVQRGQGQGQDRDIIPNP